MPDGLKDKVALVTGAGRGIGRAVALALAREGAAVVLAARTESDLEAAREEIESTGGRALVAPVDLTDEAAIRHLIDTVRNTFGRLDILVNNAGLALRSAVADTPTEDWDRTMAVNVRAPFVLCREALPLMSADDGAEAPRFIVNIASVVGVKGYVAQAAYTASKHALMGFTKVFAQEAKPLGIRVHAICPGGVATPMVQEMRPDLDTSVLMAPEEIADIVLFLVTRRGNAVIDQVNVRRQASEPWF